VQWYDHGVEPADLTVRILQEIREDIRGVRDELRESRAQAREELQAFREDSAARFEVIETTLRDLAQQMVMLGRAVKVAIEARDTGGARMDELERRVAELEKHTG